METTAAFSMNPWRIFVLGFGKMPMECARILITNAQTIHLICETEESRFSTLSVFCERNAIPFKKAAKAEITSILMDQDEPTVIFSINNNYIFPTEIVNKQNLRIINFHNSLLPAYPGHGRIIPVWTIFNGEVEHGSTWHFVNSFIDAGKILFQQRHALLKNDTALDVMMRAITIGTALFETHWREFFAPELIGSPQHKKERKIYGKNELPNNGYLDTTWDFETTHRFLRSMDYGPFRFLPYPKIKINAFDYSIKKYSIDNRCHNPHETITLAEDHDTGVVTAWLHYADRTIRIEILKE